VTLKGYSMLSLPALKKFSARYRLSAYARHSLAVLLLVLSGCASVTSSGKIAASKDARWMILPIDNLSSTPLANEAAASLLETQLRSRGVRQLNRYRASPPTDLAAVMDSSINLSKAIADAQSKGVRYGITGDIHEWQYKNGIDKEPVIGMSLKLVELTSLSTSRSSSSTPQIADTSVLWQANHTRAGWGFVSLSKVADKVISEMLEQIELTEMNEPMLSERTAVNNPVVSSAAVQP